MPASSVNTRVVEIPLMPPAWALPFVLLLPFTAWLDGARRALTAVGGAASVGVSDGVIVAGTLAVVVASVCAETAFYAVLWAARGQRLALGPLALALWQLSALEPLAGALMERMPPGSIGALWLAPWLGARALTEPDAAVSGWFVAFASAGLLAAFRVMASAHVQARLASRPWREAAAQVMLVWLVSHIALAWLIELSRGRGIGPL